MSKRFDTDCTVRVSHTFLDLSANVFLDGDVPIYPGDRVWVHGSPISVPYGETHTERRRATVTRAGFLRRTLSRLTGDLETLNLLDIRFTDRRTI